MAFIIAYKIRFEFAVSSVCYVHKCFSTFIFVAYVFNLYFAALRQGSPLSFQERHRPCFVCQHLCLKKWTPFCNILQTFTLYPGRHLSWSSFLLKLGPAACNFRKELICYLYFPWYFCRTPKTYFWQLICSMKKRILSKTKFIISRHPKNISVSTSTHHLYYF